MVSSPTPPGTQIQLTLHCGTRAPACCGPAHPFHFLCHSPLTHPSLQRLSFLTLLLYPTSLHLLYLWSGSPLKSAQPTVPSGHDRPGPPLQGIPQPMAPFSCLISAASMETHSSGPTLGSPSAWKLCEPDFTPANHDEMAL